MLLGLIHLEQVKKRQILCEKNLGFVDSGFVKTWDELVIGLLQQPEIPQFWATSLHIMTRRDPNLHLVITSWITMTIWQDFSTANRKLWPRRKPVLLLKAVLCTMKTTKMYHNKYWGTVLSGQAPQHVIIATQVRFKAFKICSYYVSRL